MEKLMVMPSEHVSDLLKTALAVGTSAASGVILGSMFSTNIHNHPMNPNPDWRSYAAWGCIGSILGSHWIKEGLPWFYGN